MNTRQTSFVTLSAQPLSQAMLRAALLSAVLLRPARA
jgi:hypothetical protein